MMWKNPKYQQAQTTEHAATDERKPPQDEGECLARLPRGDGNEELRVTLKTYLERPYFALRIWERNRAGDWWPVRSKGLSVRIGEAEQVAKALLAVASENQGRGATAVNNRVDNEHLPPVRRMSNRDRET